MAQMVEPSLADLRAGLIVILGSCAPIRPPPLVDNERNLAGEKPAHSDVDEGGCIDTPTDADSPSFVLITDLRQGSVA